VILRCASGLGPSGGGGDRNAALGGWYHDGEEVDMGIGMVCSSETATEVRGANSNNYPGVINLYLCVTPLTTAEEGVYECRIMNSSSMVQTMRVGVYLSVRSESLDIYLITSFDILHSSSNDRYSFTSYCNSYC